MNLTDDEIKEVESLVFPFTNRRGDTLDPVYNTSYVYIFKRKHETFVFRPQQSSQVMEMFARMLAHDCQCPDRSQDFVLDEMIHFFHPKKQRLAQYVQRIQKTVERDPYIDSHETQLDVWYLSVLTYDLLRRKVQHAEPYTGAEDRVFKMIGLTDESLASTMKKRYLDIQPITIPAMGETK